MYAAPTRRRRPCVAARIAFLPALLLAAAVAPATARAQADAPADGFAAAFGPADTTVVVVEDPLPPLRLLLTSRPLRRALQSGTVGRWLTAHAGRVVDPAEWWNALDRGRSWVPTRVAVGGPPAAFADLDHLARLLAAADLLARTSAGRPDNAPLADDRARLRRLALAELQQLRVPAVRAYVRFRSPADAAAALAAARAWVVGGDPTDLPPGVTIVAQAADALTVRVAADPLLGPDDAAVVALLARAHLVDLAADGEAAARQVVAAVRAVAAEASVERVGTGLIVTVGPAGGPARGADRPGGGDPAGRAADLPPAVGRPDADTLAWADWDAARLKAAAAGWAGLHDEWARSAAYVEAWRAVGAARVRGPAAGPTADVPILPDPPDAPDDPNVPATAPAPPDPAAVPPDPAAVPPDAALPDAAAAAVPPADELSPAELPTDAPLLDALRWVAVRVRGLPAAGSARAWVDPGRATVRWAAVADPPPPATGPAVAPPAPPAWADAVPADAGAYAFDADASLADLLSDRLADAEGWVTDAWPPTDPRPGGRADRPAGEVGYYAHFARLRDLVHREARGRFGPGSAVIVGHGRTADRVEVSLEVNARPARAAGRGLFVPEVAVLGRPRAGPAGAVAAPPPGQPPAVGPGGRWVEEAYAALLTGVRSAARPSSFAGRPFEPVDRVAAVPSPADLGVPSWSFDLGDPVAATGEARLRVAADGAVDPHFFMAGDVLVLSTSRRLSRAILDARAGKASARAAPPADLGGGGGPVVAAGRVSGEVIARWVDGASVWRALLAGSPDPAAATRPADPADADPLDLLAHAARLVDRVEWHVTRADDRSPRVTRGAVYFEPAP